VVVAGVGVKSVPEVRNEEKMILRLMILAAGSMTKLNNWMLKRTLIEMSIKSRLLAAVYLRGWHTTKHLSHHKFGLIFRRQAMCNPQ
jgi:hypothetical protein